MRVPTDMPKRRRRGSGRGRVIFIVAALVLFLLVTSLRGVAGFWTDYLWFESLDLGSVFTGMLGAKIALGAIFTGVFFVLCFLSLTVADRLAPKFRPQGPEDELLNRYHATLGRRAGLVRAAVSLIFGLVAGVGVSGEWQQWLLFRNGGDFGVEDATFQTDVGFYVFKLPFYSTVVNWLFASGVIILIITIVAHYINGGIRLQAPVQRVTPQVKAHISVILALLALVKAADYWLQRYALTYSTRGTVDGALYTDVNAQLPAIYLLLVIALLSFVLFIYNIWRRGWVLPVVAVGLWALVAVIAGTAYPAVIQRVTVEPAESTREAPYIEHNIQATRQAMGLDQVDTVGFDYTQDEEAAVEAINNNPGTIRNIRLLDPSIILPTFQRLQSQVASYEFNDIDVDRYQVLTDDGSYEQTQVVIGARDLSVNGIPQQSWEGRHLAYTHGYGAALAPANATTSSGQPNFIVQNVPTQIVPEGAIQQTIDRPQMYYGEDLPGYAITNTERAEIDFNIGGQEEAQETAYDGTGGVPMDSWLRKAAMAARFGDWNLLISEYVTPESRIVFQRDVQERIREVAPFLQWDADPYPVIANGRIQYLFDGYTTTDRYPNAQRADTGNVPERSGLYNHRFNYVRNSVKGIIDTYDGTVTLYVVDPGDPMAEAWQKAFPDLFRPLDDFPSELRDHWRYPEDLFRVQTNMWSRYHVDDPAQFYERTITWSVAQDPGSVVTGVGSQGGTTQIVPGQGLVRTREDRIDPYYMLLKLPGEDEESFVSLRPYVPFSEDDSRRTLTAFMVVHSDPDRYGELTVYEMPGGTNIDGPSIVEANIRNNQEVSERISLLNQQGSRVTLGNMLLLPIDDSIVYVRPFYVASDTTSQVPEVKEVIVVHGERVAMEPTLREALIELFPTADPETFEDVGDSPTAPEEPTAPEDPDAPTDPSTPPTTAPEGDQTADQLVDQAVALLQEAEQALRESGDLAAYQQAVREAASLLAAAQALRATPPAGTTPPTTTAPTTTTTTPVATEVSLRSWVSGG